MLTCDANAGPGQHDSRTVGRRRPETGLLEWIAALCPCVAWNSIAEQLVVYLLVGYARIL